MKNLIKYTLFVALILVGITSCVKKKNYSNADHTAGMGGSRSWSGTANGFYKGDTLLSTTDTTHSPWPKVFSRVLTDTLFPIVKVNGYMISVLGTPLAYRTTDSVAQTVRFDSTLTNSATTILTYYYAKDSMAFEYHRLEDFNTPAGNYYQTHEYLHTN